ncbi:MAG: hypothetical protein JWM11_2603, partial [Planctomycetaceae bacterium]|nr:hypothetical protein [Planctomycetaceae bacterium]
NRLVQQSIDSELNDLPEFAAYCGSSGKAMCKSEDRTEAREGTERPDV